MSTDAGEHFGHARQLLEAEPEKEVPPLRSSHLHHRLQTARLYLMAPPLLLVLVHPTHTVMPIYQQIMDGSPRLLLHRHQWLHLLWISRAQMAFILRRAPFPPLRSAEDWKLLNLSHHHLLHPLTPPLAQALPHQARRRLTDTRSLRLHGAWATRFLHRA